jgi:hypothetical protein
MLEKNQIYCRLYMTKLTGICNKKRLEIIEVPLFEESMIPRERKRWVNQKPNKKVGRVVFERFFCASQLRSMAICSIGVSSWLRAYMFRACILDWASMKTAANAPVLAVEESRTEQNRLCACFSGRRNCTKDSFSLN